MEKKYSIRMPMGRMNNNKKNTKHESSLMQYVHEMLRFYQQFADECSCLRFLHISFLCVFLTYTLFSRSLRSSLQQKKVAAKPHESFFFLSLYNIVFLLNMCDPIMGAMR